MVADQPIDALLSDIGEFVAEPGLWQRGADGVVLAVDADRLGALE